MDSKMLVDLSKYKFNLTSIIEKTKEEIVNISQPFIARSSKGYSYYVEDLKVYFIKDLVKLEEGNSIQKVSIKILTRPNKFEKELNDFYIENENSTIEIPFEYYSRAYIDPIDFQDIKEVEAKPLKFQLDRLGRLHLDMDCIYSFIYAVEKKLPTIKASIEFSYRLFTTIENQQDLCNKYLDFYFKLAEYEGDGLSYLSSGYAYRTLKNCNPLYLDYFLMFLIRIELDGTYKTHNGTIFRDGSYLIHESPKIHHDMIMHFLLNKTPEYCEKYFIKLSSNGSKYGTLAEYNIDKVTKQQEKTLQLFKSLGNVREYTYSFREIDYLKYGSYQE